MKLRIILKGRNLLLEDMDANVSQDKRSNSSSSTTGGQRQLLNKRPVHPNAEVVPSNRTGNVAQVAADTSGGSILRLRFTKRPTTGELRRSKRARGDSGEWTCTIISGV